MTRWRIWCLGLLVWTALLVAPNPTTELGLDDVLAEYKYAAAKTLHVVAYGCMAFFAGWLRTPMRYRWGLVFVLMAHGTVTELIQTQIEGRTGTLRDVGYDHAGVCLGLLLGWKWWTAP